MWTFLGCEVWTIINRKHKWEGKIMGNLLSHFGKLVTVPINLITLVALL